jgi:hypothetical protein
MKNRVPLASPPAPFERKRNQHLRNTPELPSEFDPYFSAASLQIKFNASKPQPIPQSKRKPKKRRQ